MPMSKRTGLERIIFQSDTRAGKIFDVGLIFAIIASVLIVILESVASVRIHYGIQLYIVEWVLTGIFTLEYLLRLYAVRNRKAYIFSFFGIIDFLAVLPTYLSLFIPGAQSLLIIRVFRLLRVFRIFKLAEYLGEGNMLLSALRASGPKITVFLMVVLSTVLSAGAMMYVVEGPETGFNNIPTGIYWAIVTMTTVGFGDITPQTPLGQFLASCLMIVGYGVIAVPTGIVTTEIARASQKSVFEARQCHSCQKWTPSKSAPYCMNCGAKFDPA